MWNCPLINNEQTTLYYDWNYFYYRLQQLHFEMATVLADYMERKLANKTVKDDSKLSVGVPRVVS